MKKLILTILSCVMMTAALNAAIPITRSNFNDIAGEVTLVKRIDGTKMLKTKDFVLRKIRLNGEEIYQGYDNISKCWVRVIGNPGNYKAELSFQGQTYHSVLSSVYQDADNTEMQQQFAFEHEYGKMVVLNVTYCGRMVANHMWYQNEAVAIWSLEDKSDER